MHLLKSDTLTVSILDPVEDCSLLGSRYCTGGYIWQIVHKKHGELLSGPCFPQIPPVFDGQGAPEVFESAAPDADIKPIGAPVLIPGVGIIKKTSPIIPFHSRNNPEVISFCTWNININPNTVTMTSTQSLDSFNCSTSRIITLRNSTLTSKTAFRFTGPDFFTLSWFAHPFFPLNSDLRCCRLPFTINQLTSNAFSFDNTRQILHIRPSYDYSASSYTPLDIPSDKPIVVNQFHPATDFITISTDFPVSKMPVWTNRITFSFEPYFQKVLNSSKTVSWSMIYQF